MSSEALITGAVALTLVLVALLTGWRQFKRLLQQRRRQRLISGYGIERLDNVILDDGMGGQVVVEHVLLTASGLLVLLPRHCDGDLFGAEKIERWTQMVGGGRSFHFANPLHRLEELLATLRYTLPGIPLEGRVLFSGRCRFPKGRPERLLLVEELTEPSVGVGQAVVPVLQEAWQKLKAQPTAERVRDEEGGVSLPPLIVAGLLFVADAGWLAWRLL